MANEVFLYWANIVDYVRLALLLAAFAVAQHLPGLFLVLYAASQLMDMLDGHLARLLGQCTSFGAVLDMVLDRASNSMFFVLLSTLYPAWTFGFSALALLDLCSHWALMYSSLLEHKHHKQCRNSLLHLYYNKYVLGLLCAGNEGCWAGLYALHWAASLFPGARAVALALLVVCVPLSAFKQLVNLVQWWEALCTLATYDLSKSKKPK